MVLKALLKVLSQPTILHTLLQLTLLNLMETVNTLLFGLRISQTAESLIPVLEEESIKILILTQEETLHMT